MNLYDAFIERLKRLSVLVEREKGLKVAFERRRKNNVFRSSGGEFQVVEPEVCERSYMRYKTIQHNKQRNNVNLNKLKWSD